MQQIYGKLQKSMLFRGNTAEEIQTILQHSSYKISCYEKEEFICHAGQKLCYIGIVKSGSAHIISEDFWGNRAILETLGEGDIFGESFVFSQSEMSVSVSANEPTKILWVAGKDLFSDNLPGRKGILLLYNMLEILANKNRILTNKIHHLSKKTTREKLMSYLSGEANRQNTNQITIPFNRQELADYLCVDRSALSAEISKMQKAGLISYHKNHFELKETNLTS